MFIQVGFLRFLEAGIGIVQKCTRRRVPKVSWGVSELVAALLSGTSKPWLVTGGAG